METITNEQPAASNEPLPSRSARSITWLAGRRGLFVACALTALFAIVAFAPAIHNKFVYDDHPFILQNPSVNPGLDAYATSSWYRIWLEPYWPRNISPDVLYRPLATLSARINARAAGTPLQAWRFRVVNIALHVLTSIAVVILAWRLTGSAAAGALAGVLFASHPVHTEAVVPIYGRSELLAAFFGTWLLARHVRPPVAGQPRSAWHITGSALIFLAAIMSKEHAMFLWPTMMAIDLWHWRRAGVAGRRLPLREWFNRFCAPAHVGFALAAATFLFFRYLVFGWKTHLEASRTNIYDVPMAHAGPVEIILTPFRLLWVVIRNLVTPDTLCPIWSYPALMPADKLYGDVLAGMAVVLVLLIAVGVLWYRRDLTGAMLVGLGLTLAIPIQAIPVARWFYAERWLYLPTVLAAVLIAAAVRRWGRAAAVGGLAVGFLLLPQSWQYSTKFSDNVTMQREVILRQPNNFQGRRNYAWIMHLEGHHHEAIQAANQLLERFGDGLDAYGVLLESYLKLGDGRRAMQAIDKYEHLRAVKGIGGGSLISQREQAAALIAQQRSQPATEPAPLSHPAS